MRGRYKLIILSEKYDEENKRRYWLQYAPVVQLEYMKWVLGTGCRPPPPSTSTVAKAGKKHLNKEVTPSSPLG